MMQKMWLVDPSRPCMVWSYKSRSGDTVRSAWPHPPVPAVWDGGATLVDTAVSRAHRYYSKSTDVGAGMSNACAEPRPLLLDFGPYVLPVWSG
jgi:hypothetical protein